MKDDCETGTHEDMDFTKLDAVARSLILRTETHDDFFRVLSTTYPMFKNFNNFVVRIGAPLGFLIGTYLGSKDTKVTMSTTRAALMQRAISDRHRAILDAVESEANATAGSDLSGKEGATFTASMLEGVKGEVHMRTLLLQHATLGPRLTGHPAFDDPENRFLCLYSHGGRADARTRLRLRKIPHRRVRNETQ